MLQIQNTIVSLDILEQYFLCDLEKCLGECCIEGDAGAPITEEEHQILKKLLPIVWEDLTPAAKEVINEKGVAYIDEEGDLVTSIVNGKDCVFTTYGNNGMCFCALEKAFREKKSSFYKPISCHLYPARLTEYPDFTAVNYHKWRICRCAEILGKNKNIRVYQFLKEPLIRRFGKEWYDELCLTAEQYFLQNPQK